MPAAPHAPQALQLATSGGGHDELTAEVLRIRAVLEAGAAIPKESTLAALARLKGLGLLPTKVLAATKIGIVLKDLSKASGADPGVRAAAYRFVDEWRQAHRKRKGADAGEAVNIRPLKPCLSTDSVPSEPCDPSGSGGKQDLVLWQPDHLTSSESPSGLLEQRSRVRDKILEELGKEEELDTSIAGFEAEMRDPVILSTEIEEALFQALKADRDDLGPYMRQSRALLYNLRDPRNPDFRFKLAVGFFKPADVPAMTPESMARSAKSAERTKIRKAAVKIEDVQSESEAHSGQLTTTGIFTCGKCQGTKTTHFQMKTRCSDEPMTTYITCLGCGNRWKIC